MDLKGFYTAVGGSYEDVLGRLPSEALVRRFLAKFPADPSYAALTASLAAEDWESAFRAVHTMKGTAANLGLTTLQSAASALTEALRPLTGAPDDRLVSDVTSAYDTVLTAIHQLDD